MDSNPEVTIGTVDVWQLERGVDWPIMKALARGYVDQVALNRYVSELLATRRWSCVRVTPHPNSPHLSDVFGTPSMTFSAPTPPLR